MGYKTLCCLMSLLVVIHMGYKTYCCLCPYRESSTWVTKHPCCICSSRKPLHWFQDTLLSYDTLGSPPHRLQDILLSYIHPAVLSPSRKSSTWVIGGLGGRVVRTQDSEPIECGFESWVRPLHFSLRFVTLGKLLNSLVPLSTQE